MLDDDDFIVSDGDDDSEDDSVDDLITQLCEEHKVIQEQQADVSALRSAGIYRPTTPGYKARSTTTTPAQTPRLDERSVFISSNPTLSQEWEDQIVPYSMPNTYRGTSAARTRTPHTPPHRVSISADNTPIGKIDTRVEYKPTENNENKTPMKTKTRKNNNNNYSNMDSTPNKTPSKILPLSIPISPVPSFSSSSSYSYSSKPSAVEHIHTNTNMKAHSYSPKHTDKHTFPSPPRTHHSKPPISPSHFHNSNLSNHFNMNSNSNSEESEISPLPKSRSKKNLRVPMPFTSSTSHELNNESLHTSLCKELDWYSLPPSPSSSKAKNRPTSAPSSRKVSNVHASPPRVTVTSSPTSPRIPTSPYAVSPR